MTSFMTGGSTLRMIWLISSLDITEESSYNPNHDAFILYWFLL